MEDKGYVRQKKEKKKMARQIKSNIKGKEEKKRTKTYAEKRIGNAKKARRRGEEKNKSRVLLRDKKTDGWRRKEKIIGKRR